jgi:aryl-alcohol dehydrogenase-like predicted oxidoreductase
MQRAGDILWRGESVSRLVLGTAQLGMSYGIANVTGPPTGQQARELISEAWKGGVRCFDTAQAYGDSEAVLGAALAALGIRGEEPRIITKLAPGLDPCDDSRLRAAVDASCDRLGVQRLWGLMLHREEWLMHWEDGLGASLRRLQGQGRVRYLGASVYGVDAARAAMENPDVDLIQVPCNAWDARMREAGVFESAKRRDKLCFVRSIYLQGLLTLPVAQVERWLPAAAETARRWHAAASACGVSPKVLAFRFALAIGAPLVVGAETAAQVQENVELLLVPPLTERDIRRIRRAMGSIPEEVLLPSLWPSRAREQDPQAGK